MKKLTYLTLAVALLIGVAVTFDACKKEEEKTNQPPTCLIITPTNRQEIAKGETVLISVEANDSDGTISEVRFYIDGVGKSSANSFPFNYEWDTDNESIGSHLLTTTSIDNSGGSNSDEITVEIMQKTTFTDSRDGQTYDIVIIGSQAWFAENLNYETSNSWWYDNNSANGDIYGRLYTWDAAMTACPSGWHLPSRDEEWKMLEGNTDTQYGVGDPEWDGFGYRGYDVGKRLKTTTGWFENTGTDAVGFSALPGGYRDTDGNFANLGNFGYWWSATEGTPHAWYRNLNYGNNKVGSYDYDKENGFSVRCLKD